MRKEKGRENDSQVASHLANARISNGQNKNKIKYLNQNNFQ